VVDLTIIQELSNDLPKDPYCDSSVARNVKIIVRLESKKRTLARRMDLR